MAFASPPVPGFAKVRNLNTKFPNLNLSLLTEKNRNGTYSVEPLISSNSEFLEGRDPVPKAV
jgi:hypothetical protein